MRFVVGVDGGGTRTTVVLADAQGREILRRSGPAGLVDPRRPAERVDTLASLIRVAAAEAGLEGPAAVLCAGLAGVGNVEEREVVRAGLAAAGVAERVHVLTDGEIALEGALGEGAGILLIAGTGSVAYGRGEDGRVKRCGGWGMVVGDEGSGYAVGRAALNAALRAEDGRGEETRLLPVLLEALGLSGPREIPPWVGRAEKAEVAALTSHVIRLAGEGDPAARAILAGATRELALHAEALVRRLGHWSQEPAVVFFGGVFRNRVFSQLVEVEIRRRIGAFRRREPAADAVTGAVRLAAHMLVEA